MEIYLQRRSVDAKVLPNHYGFWGGGAENSETAEEALKREIREEMGIELDMKKVSLFNHYEFLRSTKDAFLFRPDEGWENKIIIGEGDYGKWFKLEEALENKEIIFEDKVVLNDLDRIILNGPIR